MNTGQQGLFASLFDHGGAGPDEVAWLQAMLDAEAALARALEHAGLAPVGAGAAVTAVARAENFDLAEIGRLSAATGNPVPALVRALTSRVAEDSASTVHLGATSQDIIDTAMMLLARRVLEQIQADLAGSAAAAAKLAAEHARTVMAGRTLLQQAVPVTFGLLAAGWLTALDEAAARLRDIREQRLAVQLGGAAGTLSALGQSGPRVAAQFAAELGLREPVLPWHTDRLRVLELGAGMAGACAAMGKIGRDVTLLAQTEIAEVREDTAGSGGSSAMPQKRNPVAAVLVVANARRAPLLLANLAAAAEQELQRAAGAWHSEWEPLADLLRLTASAGAWTAELLTGLEVDAARMRSNLAAAHELPMAEQVATLLIPALGRLQALDLIAQASRVAAASDRDLTEVLLGTPSFSDAIARAEISPADVVAAARPEASLGAAQSFVGAALAAHAKHEQRRADDK